MQYLHSTIATVACVRECFTFRPSRRNLHNYSFVLVRRNLFRHHSRGQSILRFSLLYICSRTLSSFARVVPKYLNFAVQADRSSYDLDIRQMLLFISCLQQSAPSDYFAWLVVCEPRHRPQRRSALVVNTVVTAKKASRHS